MKTAKILALIIAFASGACQAAGLFGINIGDDSARTPATGAAGGAQSQNANNQLERCDRTMGTLAVHEDQQARWYYQLRNEYKLESTVPLIRLLIQQSNCFVVVERGKAMRNVMQERALEQSGETRAGSNFGKGQLVSADYTMDPMITFSSGDTGGVGGALGSLGGLFGSAGSVIGAVAGSLKFREAATTLTLIDNRSGVQLAAAEGAASKTDFGAWGGVFGSGGGAGLGGYTKTPEGKVLAGAFADAYNQLVRAVKNYKAQEVEGGLGTGGTLGVQGGSTPASRDIK